jgi:hypothetical protein
MQRYAGRRARIDPPSLDGLQIAGGHLWAFFKLQWAILKSCLIDSLFQHGARPEGQHPAGSDGGFFTSLGGGLGGQPFALPRSFEAGDFRTPHHPRHRQETWSRLNGTFTPW